ncbi:MAG: hypothetical protein KatS3mg014_0162 [Actinomycetota bacterium]|nr:MAG: hypothetical protein KatS3mg014_0162 [Actinomycetota bacterium]
MTCVEVRELLPEYAVGVLSPAERAEVDRHLGWCAGCAKEAAELSQAAALVGFALPPAPVPERLADRVLARMRAAVGPRGSVRRARAAAAAALAAVVAVAGLGWGAVMAGRAERFAERAERAERRQAEALAEFRRVVDRLVPGIEIPRQETFLGQLAPVAGGSGGGAVLELVSPTRIDFVVVMVSGLHPEAPEVLPYRVRLENGAGEAILVGRIAELDADGAADLVRQFPNRDLTGFTEVRVVDALGRVALAGSVDQTPASEG